MKKTIYLLTIITLLAGCATRKPAVVVHQKDSTRTEIRYERVFVHDTAYIEVPAQTAERTTLTKFSHLENDFAVSDARINEDGTIFHDLNSKAQKYAVQIEKVIERRDSLIYVSNRVEVPVHIEKPLTKWQRMCVQSFPYMLAIIVWLVAVIFRKPIFSFVKRLFI